MKVLIADMSTFTFGVPVVVSENGKHIASKRITSTSFVAHDIVDFAKENEVEQIYLFGNELFVDRYKSDIQKLSNIKTTFTKGGK